MTDTPDIEALVADLRKTSVCVFIACAPEASKDISEKLRNAADALERQQAVVEAARNTVQSMSAKVQRERLAILINALAALDALPEGGGC